MISERQLIKDCQKGVKASQYELVTRYSAMLMTVCRRYTRDGNMAKDVLQETWIRIFKNIDKYKTTGSFEGWMRRIAVNAALRYIERSHFTKEIYPDEPVEQNQKEPEIYSRFGVDAIIAEIQKLPDGYRAVLNLHLIEGYSHKEIGALLEISEATSRSQFSRGRRLLQIRLKDLPKKASA